MPQELIINGCNPHNSQQPTADRPQDLGQWAVRESSGNRLALPLWVTLAQS